ncbi:8733_t:CDS:1, partial [Dentiscutata erythropus]
MTSAIDAITSSDDPIIATTSSDNPISATTSTDNPIIAITSTNNPIIAILLNTVNRNQDHEELDIFNLELYH